MTPRHARLHVVPRPTVRLVLSGDLPDGINALASADGSMVLVRAGIDRLEQRRAVRTVLALTHRFPGLVAFPALAGLHARQITAAVGDVVSRVLQVAAGMTADPSAALVALGAAAVLGTTAAGGAMASLTGSTPPRPPADVRVGGRASHGGPGGVPQGLTARPARPTPGDRSPAAGSRQPSAVPPASSPGTEGGSTAPGGTPPGLLPSPAGGLLSSVLPSLPPLPTVTVSVPPVPLPSPPVPLPSPTCITVVILGVCVP